MRACNESGVADFSLAQKGGQVVNLVVRFRGRRRAPVTTAVVTDGVKAHAKSWPDIFPNRGVYDPVVKEHNRSGTSSALLVIRADHLRRRRMIPARHRKLRSAPTQPQSRGAITECAQEVSSFPPFKQTMIRSSAIVRTGSKGRNGDKR